MRASRVALIGLLVLCGSVTLAAAQAAQQATPWIHVQVDEDGEDGTKVNVNLPLSLVEVALEAVSHEHFSRGHVHLEHTDVTVQELRQMWQELRQAGDAEYVEIEDGDERVRVFREGETVFIHVDDVEEAEEKVRVEVPFRIVDVLLEGEGNELNIAGAIREVSSSMRGDIVTVNDGRTRVRVWIDERD